MGIPKNANGCDLYSFGEREKKNDMSKVEVEKLTKTLR